MARAVGIAAASVVKISHNHGLAPHRWRSFKLSNDKAFAQKLNDVVGLHVSQPAHAIILSVDEKSQIQALDRTQPGLLVKRGRGATMTHDYKCNGTRTLFALDGSVIGGNMQRHRHQEFIRFLNAIEAEMPADKAIHIILDHYATHKQPTSNPGSVPGWQGIRVGPSISSRPLAHGSMPSRGSLPSSSGGE